MVIYLQYCVVMCPFSSQAVEQVYPCIIEFLSRCDLTWVSSKWNFITHVSSSSSSISIYYFPTGLKYAFWILTPAQLHVKCRVDMHIFGEVYIGENCRFWLRGVHREGMEFVWPLILLFGQESQLQVCSLHYS